MDDDELRRGRPTSHVEYGENVAILAGDGLFAEAMRLDLRAPGRRRRAGRRRAARAVGAATGVEGMVGGQYIDVTEQGLDADGAAAPARAEDRDA